LNEKLEKIQERFAIGEIDNKIYDKFSVKFKNEINEIEKEIRKLCLEKSNLDSYIEKSLQLACNLHSMWSLGSYTEKQKLQNLLFPNGIYFHKENNTCRTTQPNSVLELINSLSVIMSKNKKGQKNKNVHLSHSVLEVGIEPTLPKELDFESTHQKTVIDNQ
jgi:hypothetical protein